MKKRMLSLICVLAMVLGMIIPSTYAVTDTVCDCGATNVEWITLTADTALEPGKHYRLEDDLERGIIHLNQASHAGTYCLDLAGHTLCSPKNRAFALGATNGPAVTFNIMDSSANGTGRVEGFWGSDKYSAGVVYLYSGTTMNVYGGTITSTNNTAVNAKNGGVIMISSGATLNMLGGSVIGGTVADSGGAICVSGSFNMSGGTVTGGAAATGDCVFVSSNAKVKLSGNASIEELYFGGNPAACLTISGTYTGAVTLDTKTQIASDTAIAAAANSANISGANISVKGTDFAVGIDGSNVVATTGSWCQACQKTVVWTSLAGALPAAASGHYKLTKNVSVSQVSITSNAKICLDLAGHTYTGGTRAFILNSGSGADLHVMDSSEDQTGVLQGAGSGTGGVIYAYKNTKFSLHSGTVQLTTTGSANKGGVIATLNAAEVNIYGGKVLGGKVTATTSDSTTGRGGAIYLRDSGTLNISGGYISSGTVTDVGACIYVESKGIVNLSGDGSADQIYFAGSTASNLTVSGKYTGKLELKFKTAPALGADIGNCSDAEILKENITVAGTTMCAAVSGSNLVTANLTGASVTDSEGKVTYFDTLAEAAAAAKKGDTIKLLADNSENVTVENATLDLFGWDLTGNITVTGKLYVKDSATDDFTVEDAKGYGVVSGTVTGDVTYADDYLPLQETAGTSYHKYVLKLDSINLRPGKTALYYTGDIRVDEAVLQSIDCYGVAVSTGSQKPTADGTDAASLYTAYAKENYGTAGTASVLITNIMDGEGDDAVNAATVIYGRPYIKFSNGDFFYGNVKGANLRQVTELIDQKNWQRLSLSQNRALMNMYDTYQTSMADWTLENVRTSVAKKEAVANDRILKVLVIGNSHGLDSTNLLYEVFKAEGLPAEYDDLVLGAMYTGGCSVSTHASKALATLPYDYYTKNDGKKADGSWTKYYDDQATLKYALEDENWDIVLLQEMNTSSARSEYFENDNIETVFTFVTQTLGYEPHLMWNMIWANPEIPESYVNHLYKNGDDGTGGDVGSGSEGDDNDTSEPAVIARKLAWIFQTQQPGALELWGKNYVKLWENNRQVMYNNIVSNVHKYVVGKDAHGIGMDDVMVNATAIQYAIEWMGMHDQDMYRDYTHVSDLGRLVVSYLWYAKLTGKTSIDDPKYTLVSQTMENARQPLGYARDWSAYSDVIKNSVNFALANPYGVIQNLTYAEYLALTPEKQAEYQASFDQFYVGSGWTYEMWLEQAVANTTYTEYVRMTEEQKATYAALNKNFDSWYKNVVENLRYVEYFLLTDEEEIAYDELRGEAYDAWFEAAANNFTYTDYVMMTYEQQQAYKETFSNAEGFDNLYNSWLEHMTYEEYWNLTMHQKLQYKKTYSSTAKFLEWYNSVKP